MTKVDIYIDGSCSGNPGPGGWAAVCPINGKTLASCGYVIDATNNKMELMAALGGLLALKVPCDVTFHTDSNYVITCTGHNDAWLTADGRKHNELWMEIISTVKKGGHKVRFVKVKGHSGDRMNELADKLAKAECTKAKHKLGGK